MGRLYLTKANLQDQVGLYLWGYQSLRSLHVAGKEHAGERGGSHARTDAAQIRGNFVTFVADNGASERRASTTRTRELKRPE